MEGVTILLPIELDEAEAPLWETADGALLLDRLRAELALLARDHAVQVVGRAETLPRWARTLGVAVRHVPAAAGPAGSLLPPGSVAALRALAAAGTPPEAPVAIIDFRSSLLTAATVRTALAGFFGDGRGRVSVAEAPLNTAIVECPVEIISMGQLALVDETAGKRKFPDIPEAIRARMGGAGRISRPFLLDGRTQARSAEPLAAGAWHAMIIGKGLFTMDPLLPEIIPASGFGRAMYSNATFVSAIFLEEDEKARRQLPDVEVPGAELMGMDALWAPGDATVVCLRRDGVDTLWVDGSFGREGVRLNVWTVGEDGGVRPCEPSSALVRATERVEVCGRNFVGPVLAVEPGTSSVIWRLQRPARHGEGDLVEPVSLRRKLWDIDQSTGYKRNRATGDCILGRQSYPENLISTQGLWVGTLGEAPVSDLSTCAAGLRAVRLARPEALAVRDMQSLVRAVCVVRPEADPARTEPMGQDGLVRAENF
jgi:hypothetical protein